MKRLIWLPAICGVVFVAVFGPRVANAAPQAAQTSAQSSQSASRSQQAQSQGAPACSDDVHPILKRGKQPEQPDLPPCPDPQPEAAPPAGSAPGNAPGAVPLIERARYAAFEFSEHLPNYICEEMMARFDQRGRDQRALDVVSAEVMLVNGTESYRNVKIDNRPANKDLDHIDGARSSGEFSSTLLALFAPETETEFHANGSDTIAGVKAAVYDFEVRQDRSQWMVVSATQTVTAAYGGSVWIDPSNARVLRIEMQARGMPSTFEMDTVESAVDYSNVNIGGTTFLLPVHAESLGCGRGSKDCSHNVIDFRNYHEFKVDVKIGN